MACVTLILGKINSVLIFGKILMYLCRVLKYKMEKESVSPRSNCSVFICTTSKDGTVWRIRKQV